MLQAGELLASDGGDQAFDEIIASGGTEMEAIEVIDVGLTIVDGKSEGDFVARAHMDEADAVVVVGIGGPAFVLEQMLAVFDDALLFEVVLVVVFIKNGAVIIIGLDGIDLEVLDRRVDVEFAGRDLDGGRCLVGEQRESRSCSDAADGEGGQGRQEDGLVHFLLHVAFLLMHAKRVLFRALYA